MHLINVFIRLKPGVKKGCVILFVLTALLTILEPVFDFGEQTKVIIGILFTYVLLITMFDFICFEIPARLSKLTKKKRN